MNFEADMQIVPIEEHKQNGQTSVLWGKMTEMITAFQVVCEEQRTLNAKLDMLIALQMENRPTPTPKKGVQIRDPPVATEITFRENEPPKALLDLASGPRPVSESSKNYLTYVHSINNDQNESDSDSSDDEVKQIPKVPLRRSPRLQNKRK